MRATQTTTFRSLSFFLDKTSTQLQKLELQAATGKRVNKSSDDPTAISPMLSARTQIQNSERYIETIQTGLDQIDNAEGYLYSIENNMVRIKEITVATINGSLSGVDYETYADEVHQLRAAMLDDANAQVDGKFLFAGFSDRNEPFTLNPNYSTALYDVTDPTTYPVLYNGDSGAVEYEIAPNELIEVNSAGNGFMMGDFDGDGVKDSARQDLFALLTTLEEVLLAHNEAITYSEAGATATTITDGDPLGPTAEVQDLDLSNTKVAPGKSLTLTIAGEEFTYTNDTGATLTDTTLAAALVADLGITGYTLSDSGNGILTITQNPGNESDIVPITTTVNAVGPVLEDLLSPLEEAADQVRTKLSFNGNVGRRLQTAYSHMEEIKIDMEEFRSRYEDADILETITDLQQQQQSFQAALNVTAKVSELSILDYL